MRWVAILIGAGSIAACTAGSPGAPTGPVDTQLVLAPGQTADVANTNVQLRFDGVASDSRCPADALCIQLGDAVVRIEVLPRSGAARAYELHTGNKQPVRHDDLTISLENLSPYPFSSRIIAPGDYRATLRVTR